MEEELILFRPRLFFEKVFFITSKFYLVLGYEIDNYCEPTLKLCRDVKFISFTIFNLSIFRNILSEPNEKNRKSVTFDDIKITKRKKSKKIEIFDLIRLVKIQLNFLELKYLLGLMESCSFTMHKMFIMQPMIRDAKIKFIAMCKSQQKKFINPIDFQSSGYMLNNCLNVDFYLMVLEFNRYSQQILK
jgi:hypothetical protein